jgi:hypothetical protein
MRVRHVMNKHGSALEQAAEQATDPTATPPNKNAGVHKLLNILIDAEVQHGTSI